MEIVQSSAAELHWAFLSKPVAQHCYGIFMRYDTGMVRYGNNEGLTLALLLAVEVRDQGNQTIFSCEIAKKVTLLSCKQITLGILTPFILAVTEELQNYYNRKLATTSYRDFVLKVADTDEQTSSKTALLQNVGNMLASVYQLN